MRRRWSLICRKSLIMMETPLHRVEMYYSKKAELISTLEEIFQSYCWLTEKFDHLSKDLKSDNRTIASVFPDRVPYAMEEEDDDNFNQTSTSSIHSNKPRLPKGQTLKKDFRNRSMLLSKEGQLKNAVRFQTSGLNKDEALEEIDKLQKEMLALQTEREFMQSSYEYGYKKF
ncbi:protein NETWORKED 2A-like [Gossypium hirsutum]|uniref:Protein NETWORKED 2A-like n=1 Tax=Gossypium hirsutum TaxID=3635 RepID=A0ABM3B318_GOSHI|nr:protein NETWORKED 2A-like [Gossypium hirsutum]